MIFPFLPFMVHDFFPYLDKEELGLCYYNFVLFSSVETH